MTTQQMHAQSEAAQNVEVFANTCSKTSVLKRPTSETESLDDFQNNLNQLKVNHYQHIKRMDGLKNPSHISPIVYLQSEFEFK